MCYRPENYLDFICLSVDQDNAAGITTHYWLDGPGIESWWGQDFLHLSRPAHPAFYTMGTGSFPGVNRPGRGVDHSFPYSAEVKERVEIYLYSTSGPLWPVIAWTSPLCTSTWLQDQILINITNQYPYYIQHQKQTVEQVVRHDETVVLDWEQCSLLGSFIKLWKATISFFKSACLSICMEQLSFHWTDFHLSIFQKSFNEIQVLLKSDKNNR